MVVEFVLVKVFESIALALEKLSNVSSYSEFLVIWTLQEHFFENLFWKSIYSDYQIR